MHDNIFHSAATLSRGVPARNDEALLLVTRYGMRRWLGGDAFDLVDVNRRIFGVLPAIAGLTDYMTVDGYLP